MAESNSEDYPLLCAAGSESPPSPAPSTPPPWPPDPWAPHCGSLITIGGSHRLQVPPLSSEAQPKIVPAAPRNQASMDSGCDCDSTPSQTPATLHSRPPTPHADMGDSTPSPSPNTPLTLSPLSPSQPGGTESPSSSSSKGPEDEIKVLEGPEEGPSLVGGRWEQGGMGQSAPSKVTFRIDDDDDDDDANTSYDYGNGVGRLPSSIFCGGREHDPPSDAPEDLKDHLTRFAPKFFPRVPSYSKAGMLSTSSSTASMPMCRFCHLPEGEGPDTLISPCRCAGTMQFIHHSCLMRWLEISSKRTKKQPTCELCNYPFNRHKKFRLRHWQLPTCSRSDLVLHCLFVVCLLLMCACATITVICFKQDRFPGKREETDLSRSEIVTLTCGVLFFLSFFVAMYVEVKAKDTLYRLFKRFLYLNQTWQIDEYDKRRDSQFHCSV